MEERKKEKDYRLAKILWYHLPGSITTRDVGRRGKRGRRRRKHHLFCTDDK
jgi:hypothetical protein